MLELEHDSCAAETAATEKAKWELACDEAISVAAVKAEKEHLWAKLEVSLLQIICELTDSFPSTSTPRDMRLRVNMTAWRAVAEQ